MFNAIIELCHNSLHTGSQVFGVATPQSDIDIVIHPDDAQHIFDVWEEDYILSGFDQESAIFQQLIPDYQFFNEEFKTCRIKGTKYNLIICLSSKEYGAWKYATKHMEAAALTFPWFKKRIKDKVKRCTHFLECQLYYKDEIWAHLADGELLIPTPDSISV